MDYANLLPVPLTTLRQPTREIGAAAFAAMLDRVYRPDAPVRDILLQTQLVVRRSCGASIDTVIEDTIGLLQRFEPVGTHAARAVHPADHLLRPCELRILDVRIIVNTNSDGPLPVAFGSQQSV